MAGHVPKRILHHSEVHKCLLDGTILFKSDDQGETPIQKLTFYSDKQGLFLWAKGTTPSKSYEELIWDIQFVSDVRSRKATVKDSDGNTDELYLTLVYRRDGIVNLDYMNLIAQSPETASMFKEAVNALTMDMLHRHASPEGMLKKHYLKMKLHANANGELTLRHINKLMNVRNTTDSPINQWLAGFNYVKESVDGRNSHVLIKDFTEDLFFKMVDQLLHSRTNDVDYVFSILSTKSKRTPQLTLKDFHNFLNQQQRDPRLNEILHPLNSKDQASKFIAKHEGGKSDRLSTKGLMEYLMSEENNVIDLEHLNQTHDMSQPLNHYFINSSHNTYLTGHQLKSSSTAEMYIQCLLLGCRCVELDCWPEKDNEAIIITHGGTFCGKVAFEEVVAAIAEYAFVTSEYPVILSIENHCRKYPHLMQQMANTFRFYFGDKLLSQPLDEFPLEPGVALPPPEKLKYKILIKDKLIRKKGESSTAFGTLPRGASINLDSIEEEGPPAEKKKAPEGGADSPLPALSEESDESASQPTRCDSPGKGEPDTTSGGGENPNSERSDPDKTMGSSSPDAKEEEINGGVPTTTSDTASDSNGGGRGEGTSGGGKGEVPGDEEKTERLNSASPEAGDSHKLDSTKGSAQDDTSAPSSRKSSAQDDALFPVYREQGTDIDITTINVALIHQRPSEVEGISTGPLAELLNYTTGISFEGFNAAEKTNCHFYMSSFVEDKGANHIKTKPKDFVKYNMRQNSRIYPQGNRINSSNYGPMPYWCVGCQMVALNFQTSDLPVQINAAKYEFNGCTGYHQKPWVMNREGASRGVFSPFVQVKLEDIVPAKLKIKVISGYFLTTADKKCYAEVDLFGLPADQVRNRYYTKKLPGPNPFWNEEDFVFKRVLLPEMALLRISVSDEDKELIGQRVLPLNAIRPGFRHIWLRDKHNYPLPLSMVFVQIGVEDWVPEEMDALVAMLMDPISFANRALQEMSEGLDDSELAFTASQGGKSDKTEGKTSKYKKNRTDGGPSTSKGKASPGTAKKYSMPTAKNGNNVGLLPPQVGSTARAGHNPTSSIPRKKPTSGACAVADKVKGLFDNTLPSVETALSRSPFLAIRQESKAVIGHPDFRKLDKKHSQLRAAMIKRHDKTLKQVKEKVSKGRADQGDLDVLEKANKVELLNFNKTCSQERYEKKRMIVEIAHKTQMRDLKEKVHKSDVTNLSKDLANIMKKSKGEADLKEHKKQSVREMEDRIIGMGKKARNEFEKHHCTEINKLEESQKLAVQEIVKTQAKEWDELNEELARLGDDKEGQTL